jgi:hypothetical protein
MVIFPLISILRGELVAGDTCVLARRPAGDLTIAGDATVSVWSAVSVIARALARLCAALRLLAPSQGATRDVTVAVAALANRAMIRLGVKHLAATLAKQLGLRRAAAFWATIRLHLKCLAATLAERLGRRARALAGWAMTAQARNLVAAAFTVCGRLDLQQAARVEQVMVLDDVTRRRDHNTYAIRFLPRSADLARNQGCDYKQSRP